MVGDISPLFPTLPTVSFIHRTHFMNPLYPTHFFYLRGTCHTYWIDKHNHVRTTPFRVPQVGDFGVCFVCMLRRGVLFTWRSLKLRLLAYLLVLVLVPYSLSRLSFVVIEHAFLLGTFVGRRRGFFYCRCFWPFFLFVFSGRMAPRLSLPRDVDLPWNTTDTSTSWLYQPPTLAASRCPLTRTDLSIGYPPPPAPVHF